MTTPSEDPWADYQPAYPGVLTSVSDPDNALFILDPEESAENPHDDGPLDSDGLTDEEFDAVFRRPADEVPQALAAAGWPTSVETDFPVAAAAHETLQSRMPEQLKDYWLRGEGAAKIRWGTEGSFRRCVRQLNEHFPAGTEGLCANLYHEATGHWPGEKRDK